MDKSLGSKMSQVNEYHNDIVTYLLLVYLKLLITFKSETLTISLAALCSWWLCILFHLANNITSLILFSQIRSGYKEGKKLYKKVSSNLLMMWCILTADTCRNEYRLSRSSLCFSHGINHFLAFVLVTRNLDCSDYPAKAEVRSNTNEKWYAT